MAQPIWITPLGSLGTFPSNVEILPPIQLTAESGTFSPMVIYKLISGELPTGLSFSNLGIITGTPGNVVKNTTYNFVVRAINENNEIRDRAFSIEISGALGPKFVRSSGELIQTVDSVWIEQQINYTNPFTNDPVTVSLVQGLLPPGLEINDKGLLRGYPNKPVIETTFPRIATTATSSTSANNSFTVLTTINFIPNRPIIFSGTTFGGIVPNKIYYVKEVLDSVSFTISATQFGSELYIAEGTGFMTVTLPQTVYGEPTIRTYTFDLSVENTAGKDLATYSITVINQNLSITNGGPGYPFLTRSPTILNIRPRTFSISATDPYYGYYLLPNNDTGHTYTSVETIPLGNFESDNYFSFKIIGYTFDTYNIKYQFVNLPPALTGDVNTGWIYGYPNIGGIGIQEYKFSVRVYKESNPNIQSGVYTFSMNVYNNLTTDIFWESTYDLGQIDNSSLSTLYVYATADTDLSYRLVSGSLPPNLTLLETGEISGYVAHQPSSTQLLNVGDVTEYTFSIEAYSKTVSLIKSTKEFKISVLQKYEEPMDTLYMELTGSFEDRNLINSLLNDELLIPTEFLYRPDDIFFGKARNVIYEHQYGVFASNINQYLESIDTSFYWRNITLGPLKTAVARNENNEVIYEVVYSQIIDNLVNQNNVSVDFDVVWPTPINLSLGPWITSVTNLYTSYVDVGNQEYYTSLTTGYAVVLYPNSLPNMNKKISDSLGQQINTDILPLWMTSQQADGNTLGFTRAWVICYTKPGFANTIKNNIETDWVNDKGQVNKLNKVNFTLDKFTVNKYLTYNYDNYFSPPEWTGLPSATPAPNPVNQKDFYVLFPRKTILPNKTQL